MHRTSQFTGIALSVAALIACSVSAQEFPVKPIRIIAPAVPGGGIDIQSRIIAAKLAEVFGKPVLVDNRGGGGGIIGTDIVHIPYKGNAPGLTDTLAGQTAFMFDTIITCLPYVKADRLKGLAVTTLKRSSLAPDMPTMHESGLPGFEISAWYGILATAGTPKDVITRLNTEIVKILRAPELKERFTSQGADVVASTPEELDAYIRTSIVKWQKVLAAAGIRAD